MKYDTLISDMLDMFPDLCTEYKKMLMDDVLDKDSGKHIVFSYLFNPRLIAEIKKKSDLAIKMMNFVAEMENCKDQFVAEVAEFTVIEELCDEFNDSEIDIYFRDLGLDETRKRIREYII